jgi:uncharacterized membrane protein/protein-disulfide isomerase
MTNRARLWLLLFALLGLGASATSTVVHHRLLQDPRYLSFCDINGTFSCTSAYLSAYGSLAGVPVALLGVIWFAGVLALVLAAGLRASGFSENVAGYLFALATAGLAFTIYLAYGAFFVLKTVCLMCVLTYVAVVGIFVVSGHASSFPMTSLPQRLFRDLRLAARQPLAVAFVLLFVVGAASAIASFPRGSVAASSGGGEGPAPAEVTSDQRTEVERWFDSQPRAIVPVDPAGAAVVIVKFHDFQCPPCRQTYESYKPILARYAAQAPGRVKLITKDFPIDPECNAGTPTGTHLVACEAAVAVRLARQKSEALGDRMEEWLFTNQATLTPMGVKIAAREVAGVTDFDARYAAALDQVKADTALGNLLNVRATPTFFINGVKIDGGLQPQYLDAIIAHELRKAGR